jgi:hypothetical protein
LDNFTAINRINGINNLNVLEARYAAFAAEMAKLDYEAEKLRITTVPTLTKRPVKDVARFPTPPKRLRTRNIIARALTKNKGKNKAINKGKAIDLNTIIT